VAGQVKAVPTIPRHDAVRLLGVSDRSFARLEAEGAIKAATPRSGRKASTFRTSDVLALAGKLQAKAKGRGALEAALVSRIDALSRAAARTLGRLLAAHVEADEVEADEARVRGAVRARLLRVPADLTPRIIAAQSEGEAAVRHVMTEHLHAVLTELADSLAPAAARTSSPATGGFRQFNRTARDSKTLSEARMQLAELQTEVLNVRDRIAAGADLARRRRQRL